jgi:tetratricopeptide (TPR) repeat protein
MRTVPALTFVSLLSLLGAGCASKKIVVKPFGPKPITPKVWQSPEEARLAYAVRETSDPASRLVALGNWEAAFPNSDFADTRLEEQISALEALKRGRELFDASRKLLEIDPFRLQGMIGIVISTPGIAPTDDELEFAATACRRMVDSPEVVLSHSNLPSRPPIVTAGLTTLGWIDMQRKDYPSAIVDYYSLLALDPTQASASSALGAALLTQREDPRAQRTAIYHFTRAAAYDGPNALPPELRKATLEYVTGIYRLYFGSAEGFDNLAALAKTSAFPSGEFR